MSGRGRSILPETQVILDYLNQNGDQKYTVAVQTLGEAVTRSKFDMTKQAWKKWNANTEKKAKVVAEVVAAPPRRRAAPAPAAPVVITKVTTTAVKPKTVVHPNITEALQYVQKNGGLAKVQASITARKEQLAKDEALVVVFTNLATQVSKAS